jgi:hypothetical protein
MMRDNKVMWMLLLLALPVLAACGNQSEPTPALRGVGVVIPRPPTRTPVISQAEADIPLVRPTDTPVLVADNTVRSCEDGFSFPLGNLIVAEVWQKAANTVAGQIPAVIEWNADARLVRMILVCDGPVLVWNTIWYSAGAQDSVQLPGRLTAPTLEDVRENVMSDLFAAAPMDLGSVLPVTAAANMLLTKTTQFTRDDLMIEVQFGNMTPRDAPVPLRSDGFYYAFQTDDYVWFMLDTADQLVYSDGRPLPTPEPLIVEDGGAEGEEEGEQTETAPPADATVDPNAPTQDPFAEDSFAGGTSEEQVEPTVDPYAGGASEEQAEPTVDPYAGGAPEEQAEPTVDPYAGGASEEQAEPTEDPFGGDSFGDNEIEEFEDTSDF